MIVTRLGGQPEGDTALEFRLLGNLEVAIECMRRQEMLPRRFAVEELFR